MRQRIDAFDGLRALAFLAVFCRHTLHIRFAHMGVDMFFVLSGFLITQNLIGMRDRPTSRAFKVFFYHRVLRIIPPYYLALLLMIATGFLALADSPWYFGFVSNIRDAFAPVIDGPPVTMWSICVEEQFYLIWPFVVLLLPARALVPVLVALIFAAPALRFVWNDSNAVYRLMITRMDLLAWGGLLAVVDLRDATWFVRHRALVLGIGVAALGLFVVLVPMFDQVARLEEVLGWSLAAIVFACVLVIVRIDTGWIKRVLTQPALRYLGRISYTAYLVHVMVIALVLRLPTSGLVHVVLALVVTIALASLSWFLVEKPLTRFRITLS